MEVLVTEPIMARYADVLTRKGTSPHRWTFASSGDPALAAAAGTADVLVCSAATPELLGAMPRLRLIHVAGAGFDKIPLDVLPDGVTVANAFHHGRSIAEHVMMTSLMLLRGVLRSERDMRAGVWSNVMVTPGYPFGEVLAGRVLGVVGFGEIGTAVARLGCALGMEVRVVRRDAASPTRAGLDIAWVGGEDQLHELLGASDVVVLTVPLNEKTRGLIDAAALNQMKPTAILVNVSRGAVLDEKALHTALGERTIAGAALDVWWRNPRDADQPPPSYLDFTGFDNVVLTPHQSGHTDEVFAGRAQVIADNIDALAAGTPLVNVVV